MKLALIAAVGRNRAIGKNGIMPWHISEDLKRFKRITKGHTVLMGRKTWDSLGKPLVDRRNVVITRRNIPGVETYASVDAALEALKGEGVVFVIGGGEVYRQLLPKADRLYLTVVDQEPDADTYFPAYAHLLGTVFTLVSREEHEGYRFEDYVRG
ncbi:MAG: dihydrofolate reductase [Ignavibacteriae bacterium]|nr:dihydrofolate reductase [Ignavibacteriota bacterium]